MHGSGGFGSGSTDLCVFLRTVLDASMGGLGKAKEEEVYGVLTGILAGLELVDGKQAKLKHALGMTMTDFLVNKIEAGKMLGMRVKMLAGLFNVTEAADLGRISMLNGLLTLAVQSEETLEMVSHLSFSMETVAGWASLWKSPSVNELYLKLALFLQAKKMKDCVFYFMKHFSVVNSCKLNDFVSFLDFVVSFPILISVESILQIGFLQAKQFETVRGILLAIASRNIASVVKTVSNLPDDKIYSILKQKTVDFALMRIAFNSCDGAFLNLAAQSEFLLVPLSQMERIIAQMIQAGWLTGKMDQETSLFKINSRAVEEYGRTNWELINHELEEWRQTFLAQVVDSRTQTN